MNTLVKEKQVVLKAIDSLGRHVTPADVALKTGLPLLPVTATLNQIAAETDGHMQVSEKGDIAYRFDPGFQSKYLLQGYRRMLAQVWAKVFAAGFFLVRISFGIMLIINALIIVVLVFLLILAYSQGRGDSDDDRGGGGFFPFRLSFFDYWLLHDMLFGYPRQTSRYDYYDKPTIRKSNDSNFFFNAFSFLFGDGNPNLNFEDRKWAMIAEVIRRNNGVVTAELLSPYTGADPTNEDAVLPVLVRFDGRPEVTEAGDIVYLFPAMQVTAIQANNKLISLPSYLSEWTWKFTNVPAGQMLWVYGLAGFDFLGSWFLLGQMYAMEYARSNPLAHFAPVIYFLVISATMFIVVPIIRWLALKLINSSIQDRNAKRLANSRLLESPSDKLLRKLSTASKMKMDADLISEKNTVFTTERDSLEQEFDASP